MFLLFRRNNSLVAITFVPFLAPESQREFCHDNRHELVRKLGEKHFSTSLICKEVGEITNERAWKERDEAAKYVGSNLEHETAYDPSGQVQGQHVGVQDLGYNKSKCRACDRSMKNKISEEALQALTKLSTPGAVVQITVDVPTDTLNLNFIKTSIAPENIAACLPTSKPSFTFYRHPVFNPLYFIFQSPDCATVQERMKHTIAIPGLVHVHAQDLGVHVDQKIEIHDPADLAFEAKDERMGRFRSVYLRNGYEGTESVYENLERDVRFYDDVQ